MTSNIFKNLIGKHFLPSLVFMMLLTILAMPLHAQSTLKITGYVYDSKTRNELPLATVQLLNMDSVVIATTQAYSTSTNNEVVTEYAIYSFDVPRKETAYILKCSYAGYKTSYMSITVENIRKREFTRQLPPILMREDAKMLGEVSVSASKVKFYYKGDTVVYNADAFVLAEGSMLDALVRQMPGVSIDSKGDIYHNGKLVENLLLNGKDFFHGKKNVMLDNLSSYMVKQVEVYDKRGEDSEFLGRDLVGDKEYVMDVKLKKEYSVGVSANVEIGGGVAQSSYKGDQPYMGRLFGMRFTDHSRIAFYANVNDINDDRKPGQEDGWQPDNMKSGVTTRQMVGVDYLVDARNKKWNVNGYASANNSRLTDSETTNRTNFLETGNVYELMESNKKNKNLEFDNYNKFSYKADHLRLLVANMISYQKHNLGNQYESATYDDFIRNRYSSQSLSDGHKLTIGAQAVAKIKFGPDMLELKAVASHDTYIDDNFNKYKVFLGADDMSGKQESQYYDGSPNRNTVIHIGGGYNYQINNHLSCGIDEYLKINHEKKVSSLYLLDELDGYDDWDIGYLPPLAEYVGTKDFGNSFVSNKYNLTNEVKPFLGFYKSTRKGYWSAQVMLPIGINHSKLNYMRGRIDTTITRNTVLVSANSTYVSWTSKDRSKNIDLRYWLDSKAPDLMYLVDMRDDTDPLNIKEGNSNLKDSYAHSCKISGWTEVNKKYHYYLALSGSVTNNAIAMVYRYDATTGVKTYRAMNVNGNWNVKLQHTFRMQQKNVTLNADLQAEHKQNAGFLCSSLSENYLKNLVRTERIALGTSLEVKLGQQDFRLVCDGTWRYVHGARDGFDNMHISNYRYGISGVLRLPFHLQLATDFMVFERRGLREEALNNRDLVWNGRLSYTMMGGKLILMLDGFDILGNLSNISYSWNGMEKTETTRNVMPQYAMLHVQYKFNKMPKNKRRK